MVKQQLRLDALIRVSRVGGRKGEEFRSPKQQREIIAREADRLGAEVFWHPPALDVSGKSMDRADLAAILDRVRTRQTDGLIVAFANRLSRARVDEALKFKASLDEARGRLVVCDLGGIDLDTAAGELVWTNMLAFARFQWRERAERWDMSRRDAVRAGKAVGGAPFGYRFRDGTPRPNGGGVIDSRLVLDENAPLVRELFERKADGASWLELARWLDQAAPKPNGRKWTRQTVVGMIRNRTYLGEVRHGAHVNSEAHENLVSPGLWQRAQNGRGQRTPRGGYVLSGLIRCASCSRRMRVSSGGRRKPAVFVCATPECPKRYSTVVVSRLDAEVERQFFERLGEFHARQIDDGDVEQARQDVDRLTAEVERLAAVVPASRAGISAHQAALADIEGRLADAEARLDQLLAAEHGAAIDARTVKADWANMTLEQRRELFRAGIDTILVRRALRTAASRPIAERVLILWRGDAPSELMNGRNPELRGWSWDDDPGSLRPVG